MGGNKSAIKNRILKGFNINPPVSPAVIHVKRFQRFYATKNALSAAVVGEWDYLRSSNFRCPTEKSTPAAFCSGAITLAKSDL
jgi:hypothetical protein